MRRAITISLLLTCVASVAAAQDHVAQFVRFSYQRDVSYGIVEGDRVRVIEGNIFGDHRLTDETVSRADISLLAPAVPSKVIAIGLNYRSHIGERPVPEYPGMFAKYPTSIIGPEEDIVMPPDAQSLHYEGELVLVIGKTAKNVSTQDALDYVFGVTAGNDVSERNWQRDDLQWLRAKGSDTFGPIGPVITSGLDYDDLLVETRLNGEVRQSERTKDLVFGIADIVSYVSRYITLHPGDLIFTGTPGSTRAMQVGDVVEVEVEGVGVLRNTIVAAGQP
jgi:2-keto-4-pentenoate hydratase/2-oxohepta-3-ene-1,7-dioic acid hydratase in catechol pathway